jgi:Arm DNA-binding domain
MVLAPCCPANQSPCKMNAEILTEAKVARFVKVGLPEGKTSDVLWAAAPKGLGLRLRQGGAASWIYVYRPKGAGRSAVSRTVTIGRQDSLSLKQAEAAAGALAGEVALKKDPATERRVERAREKSELGLALGGFDASLRRRHIVNRLTIMSTLRRGLAPLLTREIGTLERKELVALIDALDAAGKPGAAQDLRKHARSLLEWAVTKGLMRYNVLAGLRRPRASRAERLEDARKGRALSLMTRSGLYGLQRPLWGRLVACCDWGCSPRLGGRSWPGFAGSMSRTTASSSRRIAPRQALSTRSR